ncbi:urease accessory protein UreF [Thiocapsa sp.]|uniref:urease accessory protein UreF n=1 Tax=Thiocapsa sp. TaxID=2024551 RepID=UPI0025E797D3|nr:urease accessory protein UreF [Thiocapsa sp.]
MCTSTDGTLPLLRLMHLVSPSLPVGGFTYSQGIEWAVETGWIRDADDLERWMADQIGSSLRYLDLPLLVRMQAASRERDQAVVSGWVDILLAGRETTELRREEAARGRALADLLIAWGLEDALAWKPQLACSQAAGFAFAADAWRIAPSDAATGYAWSWLENLVVAGIKLVPLGQTRGQQTLARLATLIPSTVAAALEIADEEIGTSTPALAIASSAHETQYTRLFRS